MYIMPLKEYYLLRSPDRKQPETAFCDTDGCLIGWQIIEYMVAVNMINPILPGIDDPDHTLFLCSFCMERITEQFTNFLKRDNLTTDIIINSDRAISIEDI